MALCASADVRQHESSCRIRSLVSDFTKTGTCEEVDAIYTDGVNNIQPDKVRVTKLV